MRPAFPRDGSMPDHAAVLVHIADVFRALDVVRSLDQAAEALIAALAAPEPIVGVPVYPTVTIHVETPPGDDHTHLVMETLMPGALSPSASQMVQSALAHRFQFVTDAYEQHIADAVASMPNPSVPGADQRDLWADITIRVPLDTRNEIRDGDADEANANAAVILAAVVETCHQDDELHNVSALVGYEESRPGNPPNALVDAAEWSDEALDRLAADVFPPTGDTK